ncbi:MAG TPA: LexA family transcriptional regulator [Candidatus Binatia bacterium]|nr:LexA family transcriptional regulator [Candidatus Binatia bacterium]
MEATFELYEESVDEVVEIPLLGVVAAGEPYKAFVLDDTLTVPAALWGGRKVFALRVRGNSMIDEGIHDGDFLIVQPRETAEDGQTVVAEIDGCVTVKKLYHEPDGAIRLQPANPDLLPLIVRGGNMCIRGVVVGVMRKYGFAAPPKPAGKRAAISPATAPTPPAAVGTDSLFDPSLNAIDQQLAQWQIAVERVPHDRRLSRRLTEMAQLGRDLQTLREWLGRTNKPGLRRALLAEANTLMRKMQRFGVLQPIGQTETFLH